MNTTNPPTPRFSRRVARRVLVAGLGSTVLALGVTLVVLPGPSSLVIPLGLAILGMGLPWARKLVDPVRKHLWGLKARFRRTLEGPSPRTVSKVEA